MDPLDPLLVPPHDEPAERVVLCGLLRDDLYGDGKRLVRRAVERAGLKREDLYLDRHRLVWDAARGVGAVGQPVTPWEVHRHLGRTRRWAEWGDRRGLGCAAWLLDLLDADPTGYRAGGAAVIVRRLALLRGRLFRARELAAEAAAEARAVLRHGLLAVG